MLQAPGRWLVAAALSLAMLLSVSGVAEAAWSATASGRARAQAISMPAGQAPVVSRTPVLLSTTNTVVIPRLLLFETTRISTFNVYRSTNGAAATPITLTLCTEQATTRTCSDTGLLIALLATYS